MVVIRPACSVTLLLISSFSWMIAGCSPQAAPPLVSGTTSATSPIKDAREAAKPATWSPWQAADLDANDFTPEDGFRTLSFTDFESFFAKPPQANTVPTWQAVGHAIVCTGKPKGYLYSKERFQDFTLRLEFRFAPSADATTKKEFNPNSGVLVYITEPHKQWPKSLEVQGRFADLATVKENGGAAKVEITDDAAARESARKPVGDWNALEIISQGGALTALLNGTKVCQSQPSDVSQGAIGLQSEDHEVHFRRLRIRSE